jgi:cyclase
LVLSEKYFKGRLEVKQNIIEIAKNIFVITENLGSNNSAIVTSQGVVLIDTPHKPSDAIKWRDFVDKLGPTKYLIITDHHIDHTLSNAFFGGTLISHEGTYHALLNNHPTIDFMDGLLKHFDPEGVPLIHGDYQYRIPDITISDRMTIYLGDDEFQLFYKKGHTPNNIMVYMPKRKILFSGDNVCENGLPSSQECCIFDVFKTLDFIIEDLDVDIIVPGHGEVCTKESAKVFRNQYRDYVNRIQSMIEEGHSREDIIESIRYCDYIHCDTERYIGYPDDLNEGFQRNSVARIYDLLTEN